MNTRKPLPFPNLDYLPLPGSDTPPATLQAPSHVSPSEWEHLICSVDTDVGQADLYSNLELNWVREDEDDTRRPTAPTSVFSSLSDESNGSPGDVWPDTEHHYGGWAIGEDDFGALGLEKEL